MFFDLFSEGGHHHLRGFYSERQNSKKTIPIFFAQK
jgi:hypothetical protein